MGELISLNLLPVADQLFVCKHMPTISKVELL